MTLSPASIRSRAWLLAAVAALSSPALAQQFVGNWEDPGGAGTPTVEFFVSPAGSDITGTGTNANPWRTVSFAVASAAPFIGTSATPAPTPAPVSINVEPGTYDTAAGEMFPISVPAFGVTIETWRPTATGNPAPFDRPSLVGTGFAPNRPLINVDFIGTPGLPPSTIQTLEFSNSREGLRLEPGVLGVPIDIPIGVEVRQNYFHDCFAIALRIDTAADLTARHIVEDNDFGDLVEDLNAIFGWAVREASSGTSSTLYRSNRIQNYEEGIQVLAVNKGIAAPRIFSNFIQLAERSVTLDDCDSLVINNTIAFATDYTGAPALEGLTINGGTFVVSNNILWCPIDPGSPGTPAVDLTINGAVGTLVTNTNEDIPADPAPQFVGGDAHPNAIPTFPVDLHLTSTSPNIAAGTNAEALDPINTVRSVVVGGTIARTDISVDIDLGGRIHRSGLAVEAGAVPLVEIGADEVEFTGADVVFEFGSRIDFPVTATQDRFGHVLGQVSGTGFTWLLDMNLTGPPSGIFAMVIGFDFLNTVVDPVLLVPTENGPVYQNLFASGLSLGNILVDLNPARSATAFSGVFNAAGTATITGVPLATGAATLAESEWYFQMLAFDAAGRGALSNRPKIELDLP